MFDWSFLNNIHSFSFTWNKVPQAWGARCVRAAVRVPQAGWLKQEVVISQSGGQKCEIQC